MREALTAEQIKKLAGSPPNFAVIVFEEGAKPWPVQTRGQAGYRAPQDPATYPKSRAPYSAAVAKPLPTGPEIVAEGDNQWTLAGGWRMVARSDGEGERRRDGEGRDSIRRTGWWRRFRARR